MSKKNNESVKVENDTNDNEKKIKCKWDNPEMKKEYFKKYYEEKKEQVLIQQKEYKEKKRIEKLIKKLESIDSIEFMITYKEFKFKK